jgi:hypothetical protein
MLSTPAMGTLCPILFDTTIHNKTRQIMSYDLMVFKKEAAPKTRTNFMKWYQDQTKWTEDHNYDDPANTSTELRNWFLEMIQTFPAMNGPLANYDDDNPNVSDYSVGKEVIYVAFSWSVAELAYEKIFELAEKHGVGFFNVSSDKGEILFPENGKLKPIDNLTNNSNISTSGNESKPWWKFW